MGLFNKFVSQTRKPEGFLGKLMVNGMNKSTEDYLKTIYILKGKVYSGSSKKKKEAGRGTAMTIHEFGIKRCGSLKKTSELAFAN